MPANVNDVIVVGIGPGSELTTFLTFGLGIGAAAPVDLTLWSRSVTLTLEDRSTTLTLNTRSTALTLEDK